MKKVVIVLGVVLGLAVGWRRRRARRTTAGASRDR